MFLCCPHRKISSLLREMFIKLSFSRRSYSESMASSMSSSVPESTSSMEDSESENEEWKITSEQREYYTNQFKKLQPNEGDVIKGL